MIKIYCTNKKELKDSNYLNKHLDISNLEKRLERQARDYLLEYIYNKYNIDMNNYKLSDKGKPYIEGMDNFYFNISHSNDFVFIGVSDDNIGIDLEYINQMDNLKIEKLMNRICSEEDYNFFYKDDNYTLKYIWTIKEAYLKYKGTGLISDLKNILIDYEKNIVNGINYKMFIFDEYVLCVVSQKNELNIDFEWVK